jgi:hypothetical protein
MSKNCLVLGGKAQEELVPFQVFPTPKSMIFAIPHVAQPILPVGMSKMLDGRIEPPCAFLLPTRKISSRRTQFLIEHTPYNKTMSFLKIRA